MRWIPVALVLLLSSAAPAAAEVQRLEAVGVAPVTGSEPTSLRSQALEDALGEAVLRVARSLVDGAEPGSEGEAALRADLGDPAPYATRFRILEDRGERPSLLGADGASTAYVVLVEAHVDADRVKARLRERGWLRGGVESDSGSRGVLRVVLEGLDSYQTYETIRDLLRDELQARSAVPELFEWRRAELRVETDRSARSVLEVLRRGAPPGLEILDLPADAGTLRLRLVDRRGSPAPGPVGAAPPDGLPN